MRKSLLIAGALLGMTAITQAQEQPSNTNDDYNRWSVELGAGFAKPARPMAPGYFTSTPSFYEVDLATRYRVRCK